MQLGTVLNHIFDASEDMSGELRARCFHVCRLNISRI